MVAGPNGAGKSTLFRVLATAIRPDRGRVAVGGFDVIREREDVRRMTAILSHHNYLYEALTARENLEVVCNHLGSSHSQIDRKSTRLNSSHSQISYAVFCLKKKKKKKKNENLT